MKTAKNKYLIIYLVLTFGLCWGLASIYMLFLTDIFGEVSFTHPGVMISLYSPTIAGVIVYGLMGGMKAIKNVLVKLIPRKQDLYWFLIVIGMAVVYAAFIHFGSLALGFGVPEMTLKPKQMIVEVLKNLYEEAGILGGVFGWYGFLLPFLQKKFNNNIKAGLLTGLIFGIYCLPGYLISSFNLAAVFPLYVLQMMCFSIFVSYMFNATNGNLLFYVIIFWLVASGSRLQLYYFNAQVQLLQTIFFALSDIAIYFFVKKRGIEQKLQVLPEYAGIEA
ncbi:MAG: hypothetical protein K0S61_932 [Anaerocolumna sp.]|jgi:hypothetical protein|nr:hypothetical protein [Anaerocolumna sp.]